MDIAAGGSVSSPVTNCTCVSELLKRISKLRRQEITIDPDDFTVVAPSDKHAWTKLFAEYFVVNAHCVAPQCSAHSDDMLWYVRNPSVMSFYLGGKSSPLEVFRRQSKKQPVPGDTSVNWEETVCLNLILQQLDFHVTCAVCTKTSPQNLQILRKNCQRVYPSPSRRRMDSKGEGEEIAYPNIYFAIDDFENVFNDVIVRDGECVCVELVARDRYRHRESAVFLGSIRYEVLKQVYDTRASNTWQWAQKLMSSGQRRQEFVRMRGPHGKGYAEMAVARVPNCGYETPIAEDLPFDDFETHNTDPYNKRRMSDTNLASRMFYKYAGHKGAQTTNASGEPVRKSQSEADSVNQYPEVEANAIDDGQ
uniref:Uncharacterized protein n=1 Tax=Plectus sambesii TaxID=2011161 RepID=A0A914XRD3_9BILA